MGITLQSIMTYGKQWASRKFHEYPTIKRNVSSCDTNGKRVTVRTVCNLRAESKFLLKICQAKSSIESVPACAAAAAAREFGLKLNLSRWNWMVWIGVGVGTSAISPIDLLQDAVAKISGFEKTTNDLPKNILHFSLSFSQETVQCAPFTTCFTFCQLCWSDEGWSWWVLTWRWGPPLKVGDGGWWEVGEGNLRGRRGASFHRAGSDRRSGHYHKYFLFALSQPTMSLDQAKIHPKDEVSVLKGHIND